MVVTGGAAEARAPAPSCDPRLVFDEMRSAMGGSAWNDIAEISAEGTATVDGLHGTARFDDDLTRGRYARRFRLAVARTIDETYDGSTVWAQDVSGGVHPYDSPYARRQAITNAYLARRGYFDPRGEARFTCLGTRSVGGREEIAIRVQPAGGSSADLAIDTQSHLLASVAQRAPLERAVVTYADYRSVGGVVLPFVISSGTKADPTDDYAFFANRYDLRRSARAADFSKPVATPDARMLGSAFSTTVPMALEGRQLLIWASINGHAPMPFILDTGGHAILTTQTAGTLGLIGAGAGKSGGAGAGTISTAYTRVRSVRIGAAELLDQPFLVIPYPYSFYERGMRTPLAGIIGLELFERYAVRLDYGDRSVTLTPLAVFHHHGADSAVPFTFESQPDEPMIVAAADGHAGLFGVDTGNASTHLILFGDFLRQTGLLAHYSGGTLLIGHGTGGQNTGRDVTLRRFELGGHVLNGVDADFTQMKTGAFAAWTQAGNVGFSILSRFVPTFDYADQTIYLDPMTRATPILENRSGIGFEKNEPGAFDVVYVRPNSPATAAGIVPGDRIVAVDGKGAANLSSSDLLAIVAQPHGTRITLRVLHAGSVENVIVTL